MGRTTFPHEDSIFEFLRRKLHGHFYKVENVMGTGTPDVGYAMKHEGYKINGVIELKMASTIFVSPKATVNIWPKIRPEQYAWWIKHRNAGGNVLVIIGWVSGRLLIVPPSRVHRLAEDFTPCHTGMLFSPDVDPMEALRDCLLKPQDPKGPFTVLLSKKYLAAPTVKKKVVRGKRIPKAKSDGL